MIETPVRSSSSDRHTLTRIPEKDTECGSTATEPENDPEISTAKAISLVAVLTLAQFSNVVSAAGLNVALPSVGADLHFEESQLQWLISAYSITSGSFLLLLARLADLYGRRLVFLLGTVWVLSWCLGCALAPTRFSIIFMRALQGMGVAANIPAALGILGRAFPPGNKSKFRSLAFATFSAGAPVGGAVGNMLGGITSQWAPHIHWRATFYVLAGLSLFIAIAGWLVVPPDPPSTESDRTVDWVGAILATLGLVLLNFALAQGPSVGWKKAYIIVILILSIVLMGTFLLWEHYLEKHLERPPLVRLDIFKTGRVSVMLTISFLAWACFVSYLFWATLYYQSYIGYKPIQVTVRFLPMAVFGLIINAVAAYTLPRVSGQILVIIGATGTTLAAVLFAIINPNATYWTYGFISLSISVFGADFIFATGTVYISSAVRASEQAMAGGVFITLLQVGTSIGLAITTIAFNTGDPRSLHTYRVAFWTCASFGMATLTLAVVGLRGIGIVGKR